jgi:hypothetical protein
LLPFFRPNLDKLTTPSCDVHKGDGLFIFVRSGIYSRRDMMPKLYRFQPYLDGTRQAIRHGSPLPRASPGR